jgi:hypothetical protein
MTRLIPIGLAFWAISITAADYLHAAPGGDVNAVSDPLAAISQILAQEGLVGSQGCFSFVDADAVTYRKHRWKKALNRMDRANPDFVVQWLIGAAPPPEEALAEASKQLTCVLAAMLEEAKAANSSLLLELGRRSTNKSTMKTYARRFARDSAFRKRLLSKMVISSYRSGREQGSIWRRKWRFVGRRFNRISPRAANLCRLAPGHAWNPDNPRHTACWNSRLDGSEREREILVASSAPGLSRHHWGTDFDVFSLNPKRFGDRATYGDEYDWFLRHGMSFGFFQPYTAAPERAGYMEERWHWSYLPIGEALLEYAQENEATIDKALSRQWRLLEDKWNRRKRRPEHYFDWIEKNWRSFVFEVDRPPAGP